MDALSQPIVTNIQTVYSGKTYTFTAPDIMTANGKAYGIGVVANANTGISPQIIQEWADKYPFLTTAQQTIVNTYFQNAISAF